MNIQAIKNWVRVSAIVTTASVLPVAHAITANNVNDVKKNVLCPIINAMFSILMVLGVIMVLYAAYLYMTAAGDAEKVGTATRTITYAAVAIVVALIAAAFPNIIASIFPGAGHLQIC